MYVCTYTCTDIITGVPRTGVIIAGSVNIRTQMDLTGESVVTNINGSQVRMYVHR